MSEKAYKGNTKPIYKGKDYTGLNINSWKILGPIECTRTNGKNYHTRWLCQCECGSSPKWIIKETVTKGLSTGCKECYKKRHSGSNNPNWRGHKEIPSSLVTHIVYGANSRGIEYSVSNEYLNNLWVDSNGKCALSGVNIIMGDTASLDRVDSLSGYIEGNVQWVHKNINMMKRTLSQDEFINICRLVADNWSA
jgi:hypothetical protein